MTCNCTRYARWMSALNGEAPGDSFYRNPGCPTHQGNSFPDKDQQRAELLGTVHATRQDQDHDH